MGIGEKKRVSNGNFGVGDPKVMSFLNFINISIHHLIYLFLFLALLLFLHICSDVIYVSVLQFPSFVRVYYFLHFALLNEKKVQFNLTINDEIQIETTTLSF